MATDLYAEVRHVREQQREKEIRARDYSGKRRFLVTNEGYEPVTVFAGSMQDAIWAAAKHWKTDPRKAAFHQGCNVRKVSG